MLKILKIFKYILIIILFFFTYFVCNYILSNKISYIINQSYIKEKHPVDIIFIGTSHVRNAIYPMELWNKYGIISYDVSGNGNTIPVIYWLLINTFDYKKPKLVVLDIYNFAPNNKISNEPHQLHSAFDFLPLSKNKIKAIFDLVDENTNAIKKDEINNFRYELLFPFIIYHSRWNNLSSEDFLSYKHSETKGSELTSRVVKFDYRIQDYDEHKYDELAKKYIIRIIESCKNNNIDIMLINTGFNATPTVKMFSDSIPEIAKKYNIDYIDFTNMNIINFDTDVSTAGINVHLNFSGAQKMTDYLGNYINNKYNFENKKENKIYLDWEKDFQIYKNDKYSMIKDIIDLDQYLVMLSDDNIDVLIELFNDNLFKNSYFETLFKNIGIEKKNISGDIRYITLNNKKQAEYINKYSDNIQTNIGLLTRYDDNNSININGDNIYLNNKFLYSKNENSVVSFDIRVIVLDKETKDIIDDSLFYTDRNTGKAIKLGEYTDKYVF